MIFIQLMYFQGGVKNPKLRDVRDRRKYITKEQYEQVRPNAKRMRRNIMKSFESAQHWSKRTAEESRLAILRDGAPTLEDVQFIIDRDNEQCQICGNYLYHRISFYNGKRPWKNNHGRMYMLHILPNEYWVTMDRINVLKGYTRENMQLLCQRCNTTKGQEADEVVLGEMKNKKEDNKK